MHQLSYYLFMSTSTTIGNLIYTTILMMLMYPMLFCNCLIGRHEKLIIHNLIQSSKAWNKASILLGCFVV